MEGVWVVVLVDVPGVWMSIGLILCLYVLDCHNFTYRQKPLLALIVSMHIHNTHAHGSNVHVRTIVCGIGRQPYTILTSHIRLARIQADRRIDWLVFVSAGVQFEYFQSVRGICFCAGFFRWLRHRYVGRICVPLLEE